jgi:Tol biopolymer transport system component
MDADGAGQARLVSIATDSWDPLWSPDGRKLSFTSNTGGYYGVPDVFVANADGSGLQRLIEGAQEARWSADGTTIAFTMVTSCYYGCYGGDVAIVKADGTGTALLTTGGTLRASAWSPNGQWISLTQTTCSRTGCVDAVRLVRKNGTGLRNLATASNASWKP